MAFFGGSPGAGEILLVLLVVLLFFGAKQLPSIARSLGRTLEEFRRAARGLSNDIMSNNDENDSPDLSPSKSSSPDKSSDESKV